MEFVKRIETLFRAGTASGLTDAQLLERFLDRRGDEAEDAFAALVDRYGAMVLRVCRQILSNEEDAEDAAQATFLVLARRAPSISRRESLGCWLHGVARRVAANVRIAHARRRTLECREGELRAAAHVVDGDFEAIENRDDSARLHDELGSLPRIFRDPLILCYLDGLTQEQAAAQLRCPLGTVQSRLARGRAKLKTQLEKRGVGLSSAFAAANHIGGLPSCPAPQAWADATVRLALDFGRVKAPSFGCAASVALAERACRAIVLSKIKVGTAMILLAAVFLSAATALALRPHRSDAVPILSELAVAERQPPQGDTPKQAFPPFESATRTIRGIVHNEHGRPVPKAWIGVGVSPRPRRWDAVLPADRIRERKEPFRDGQGKIVPAGAISKYYELRSADGKWQPIDPNDIRPCESFEIRADQLRKQSPFDDTPAADAQGTEVFEICVENDPLKMNPLRPASVADRTDAQGNFTIETDLPTYRYNKLYFASPDFTQQASRVIHEDRPYNSMEITLRPTRLVHASVIASAQEVPFDGNVSWHLERDDPAEAMRDPRGEEATSWQHGEVQSGREASTTATSFPLELRAQEGRYKLRVESETQSQTLTLVVPPGRGLLELPAIKLKPSAWFNMLGKRTAEIEAVDLEGIPVMLADLRGKVVVIVFWSTNDEIEEDFATIRYLAEIQTRFKSQPLAILALHDASVESPDRLKKALTAMDNKAGERSIRILLDHPPIDPENRREAGEIASGRTADMYECWATRAEFVIDKMGTLVSAATTAQCFVAKNGKVLTEVRPDSLVWALEDQFGLPRSPATEPALPDFVPEERFELTVIKGNLLDRAGKPIAGATVTDGPLDSPKDPAVKSGPNGEFTIRAKKPSNFFHIAVEAPGFAPRDFKMFVGDDDKQLDFVYSSIDPSGIIRRPPQLGAGVEVTGRVLKNGKPVAGIVVGVKHAVFATDPTPLRRRETKTNTDGFFRFSHLVATTDFWVYTELGSFEDGSTLIPVRVRTTVDGSTVDAGELHVGPGRTLAGCLVCSDGKAIPDGLELTVGSGNVAGDLKLHPGPEGRFKFTGLPAASIHLFVTFRDYPAPGPYRLSEKNRCLNPEFPIAIEGRLDHDITDLTVLLEPGGRTRLGLDELDEVDPAVIADFNDAKAGPITGVPPRP